MVDFASVLNGFHMDETRMFAIGRMPDKALQAAQAANPALSPSNPPNLRP
jgi:Xaa-Pro dipeptidase